MNMLRKKSVGVVKFGIIGKIYWKICVMSVKNTKKDLMIYKLIHMIL